MISSDLALQRAAGVLGREVTVEVSGDQGTVNHPQR